MAVRPQDRDPVAFEELWEQRGRVRAVCLGIIGDRAAVEDLVQDTYVRALTAVRPPVKGGPLGAWLSAVARHRAIDKLRTDRHEQVTSSLDVVNDGGDPADQLLRSERRDGVRQALAKLGARERRLLVQQAVYGMSISELAAEERTTEASVRSALWRARRKFRAALDHGGSLGAPVPRRARSLHRVRPCHRAEGAGAPVVSGAVLHGEQSDPAKRDRLEQQLPDFRPLVARIERGPDAVLRPFLARLRTRRDQLALALGGRSLRTEVVLLLAERRVVYRVVFTTTGYVEVTGAYGFDPHLRFEGRAEHLLGIVFGTIETFDAVYGKVLTLRFPSTDLVHYPAVRRVLAEEVRTCSSARRR